MTLLIRIIGTWILFVPIAFLNGAARETLYKRFTGDLLAHQISTVTASIAFLALAYLMLRNVINNLTTFQLCGIGILWVLMTMAFEFGFGHYIQKTPWEKLLADYNIFTGHVWGLFLVVIFLTPYVVRLLGNSR